MTENKFIRAKARDTLEHKLFGNVWLMLVIASLIYGAIVGIPSSIGSALPGNAKFAAGWIFSIASLVIAGPMDYGVARLFLNTKRGEKKIDFLDLFTGFKEDFQNTILLGALRSLFIFLWSLLLIVPGIIKAYSYSMSMYIQQEAKDKEWRKCLDLSEKIMYGYRKKLFFLDLSFIGWYIVGALCLGVGALWVSVYHGMARAHFYEELKEFRKDVFAEFGEPVSEEPASDESAFDSTDAKTEDIFLMGAPSDASANGDEPSDSLKD